MNPNHSRPRPAATVVIIRNGAVKPEILMVRRHSRAVFASHYVFPGGVVDPCDSSVHHRSTGLSDVHANVLLGLQDGGLDFYSAAIREAFEETSVLLARSVDDEWAFSATSVDRNDVDSYRKRLNSGNLSWPDFLEQYELRPAYDSLHYISYWVTPTVQKKRFSTRFFLAVIPDGQSAMHDDGELTDSRWMSADNVLELGKRGDMKLMYPTFSTLSDIAGFETVDEVVRWAQLRGRSGEARLLPAFVEVDGEDTVVMPGSSHYPSDFDR